MNITDARSSLTGALSQQAERVNDNAEKIARVGLNSQPNEAPKPSDRSVDKVEISAAARQAQTAANEAPVRPEPAQQNTRAVTEAVVAEQNIESVIVDNVQAKQAYNAAATALGVINEMEGSLLEQVANREA